jgi:hypothetical protein
MVALPPFKTLIWRRISVESEKLSIHRTKDRLRERPLGLVDLRSRQDRGAVAMAQDRASTGTNSRPLNDTIAGTGPGIADDALAPGQELPVQPSDEEVEAIARKLGAPIPKTPKGKE